MVLWQKAQRYVLSLLINFRFRPSFHHSIACKCIRFVQKLFQRQSSHKNDKDQVNNFQDYLLQRASHGGKHGRLDRARNNRGTKHHGIKCISFMFDKTHFAGNATNSFPTCKIGNCHNHLALHTMAKFGRY